MELPALTQTEQYEFLYSSIAASLHAMYQRTFLTEDPPIEGVMEQVRYVEYGAFLDYDSFICVAEEIILQSIPLAYELNGSCINDYEEVEKHYLFTLNIYCLDGIHNIILGVEKKPKAEHFDLRTPVDRLFSYYEIPDLYSF